MNDRMRVRLASLPYESKLLIARNLERIQDLERVVQVLSILYKNTVDVVVRSDARLSELIFDSNRFSGVHNRRLHGDHLEGTTRRRAGYTLQGQPLDPFVRTALSSRTKSRSVFCLFIRVLSRAKLLNSLPDGYFTLSRVRALTTSWPKTLRSSFLLLKMLPLLSVSLIGRGMEMYPERN